MAEQLDFFEQPAAPPPAIYVDALTPCIPNRQWRWNQSAHLYCDPGNEEALHTFARRLGLRRDWFQHKPGRLPHYDLNPTRYRAALSAGALSTSREHIVERIRKYREEWGRVASHP